ncbi:MAG TPA: type II toxin-antitoxin system PemK/MazF family toxin [Gemmataceae bacterium]|nr:type II toxin-antitoxin system PemK/MazF family toxin [Gemmataceae bacterium]
MKRGDVVLVPWVHSDLTIGKRRPAIVVQADFLNSLIANTILIQVTKTVHNAATEIVIDPGQEPGSGLLFVSVASCHNLLTVQQARVGKKLGSLSDPLMQKIEARLKVALELP